MKFDYLIVGAGFAGLVLAERLVTQLGKRCLIVEKRSHIGGNAYDYFDDSGVLIHKYGPHYFRTNSREIVRYLSAFTRWREVEYRIKSYTKGRYWSFPINLNTFEEFVGRKSTEEEMREWLETHRVARRRPRNSEEIIISQVGVELYELFFKGYTVKQWRKDPRELDASVCGRIPIRTNRDDRYLDEDFQALPEAGYTKMFERMIGSCGSNLKIMLNTDYRELSGFVDAPYLIFTGMIDEFYDYCYGRLPYRSLRFETESYSAEALEARERIAGKKGFWQPVVQVNYPGEEVDYTRIVELKHITGQQCLNTSIVKEYPIDYEQGTEPYYPIPMPESSRLYRTYKELAGKERHTSFVGRLATYKYYNMDQVVGMALKQFRNIAMTLETRSNKKVQNGANEF